MELGGEPRDDGDASADELGACCKSAGVVRAPALLALELPAHHLAHDVDTEEEADEGAQERKRCEDGGDVDTIELRLLQSRAVDEPRVVVCAAEGGEGRM